MADEKPWWMTPPQYSGEPEINAPGTDDDTPIDYSKGPDRSIVFGDDLDDEGEPTEEDLDS